MSVAQYDTDYVAPTLTIDSVIFQIEGNHLAVLLIKRAHEPYKAAWALPGGYNAAGETTRQAMSRILDRKAGLRTASFALIEQLYTFDSVVDDPRGQAVSVSYLGLGRELIPTATAQSETPTWFPLYHMPELAYDHRQIIDYALERLQAKLTYTNAIFALLPRLFTLSELQSAYEAVLARPLDKRNFRKKFLSLGLIEASANMRQDGPHRPARLYQFRQDGLQTLTRSFE